MGPDIKGEGVVGLANGFMYAGAKTVVSSLWKVDDSATAEFMSHFYKALLRDKLPPAEALRAAKLEMQKQERWRSPFFWAGFVLQGEYKDPTLARESTSYFPNAMIIVTVLLVAGCIYGFARHLWRKSRF